MIAHDRETSLKQEMIRTSFAYKGFTLIGASLVVFEIIFLVLYTSPFWFGLDLLVLGVPLVMVIILSTHSFLCWLEESRSCKIFSFLFNGSPPLVYRQLLQIDEKGIIFGVRKLLWQSIDEIALTLFGNLLIKSRKLSGEVPWADNEASNPADTILKIPFHALTIDCQKYFVQVLKQKQPTLVENARLKKQLAQPLLKPAALVQGLGVVFLAAVFIDFGYSECRFLEMLKEYYLCMQACHSGTITSGTSHWTRAESIRLNPLPISWISRQVMQQGKLNSIIAEVRSRALWDLGRKGEALQAALESIDSSPKTISYRLRAARLLLSLGKRSEAEQQLTKGCDQNKDALLPRLYMLSLLLSSGEHKEAVTFYHTYAKHLQDDYFGETPAWPPGGESFLHGLFYQEDLDFVFDQLVNN